MAHRLLVTLVGSMFLLAGLPAIAKKDGDVDGKTSAKMSQQGQTNTNSPYLGQDKGAYRADDRKSGQGLYHDQDDKKSKKDKKDNKGKSKGHDK